MDAVIPLLIDIKIIMTISKEITTYILNPKIIIQGITSVAFIICTLSVTCIYTHKLSTLRFYPNAYEISTHGSRAPMLLELPHLTFTLSSRSNPNNHIIGEWLYCLEVHFLHWLNSPVIFFQVVIWLVPLHTI